MKNSKLVLSAAVAVSTILGAGAASAADLAVKAAPYTPPPVFSWTGCYVGVHGGAGVLHDQGFQGQRITSGIEFFTLNDRHSVGALAGGQIGCNYQTGMLVLGIEGEGFWSDMKITNDEFDRNIQFASAQIRNKWDYDVAGRVGVAFDRALVYGKAGWAAGRFDWNGSTLGLAAGFTNQGSATLDGLLIGVGLEYAFLDNWTAKFEYDYLGFGSKNVLFTSRCSLAFCALSPIATFTENVTGAGA